MTWTFTRVWDDWVKPKCDNIWYFKKIQSKKYLFSHYHYRVYYILLYNLNIHTFSFNQIASLLQKIQNITHHNHIQNQPSLKKILMWMLMLKLKLKKWKLKLVTSTGRNHFLSQHSLRSDEGQPSRALRTGHSTKRPKVSCWPSQAVSIFPVCLFTFCSYFHLSYLYFDLQTLFAQNSNLNLLS